MRAQVVRAVLGFANRRDGGAVVVGVDAAPGRLTALGVDAGDIASWHSDLVADAVAAHADPSVSITVRVEPYDSKSFVVNRVAEFPWPEPATAASLWPGASSARARCSGRTPPPGWGCREGSLPL